MTMVKVEEKNFEHFVKESFNINSPKIFSSDDDELNYINSFFKIPTERELIESRKQDEERIKRENQSISEYKPIRITMKERVALVQAIRYNDSYMMPFVADNDVLISLLSKGFIEENLNRKLVNVPFKVKKNVELLFEVEGLGAFDEIIE
jgi:hypothetical protein